MTPQAHKHAISLINQLRSGTLTDAELSRIVEMLRTILPDPHFMAYTIDHVPELSAEEIVRRAAKYEPIRL